MFEVGLTELRVLLIDDDQSILDFVSLLLRDIGVKSVECSCDPAAMLDQLRLSHDNIDIILCDLNMPDVDGIEFLRYLSEIGYDKAVGILSGVNNKVIVAAEKLAKTHNLRFLGYIEKRALNLGALVTLMKRFHEVEVARSKPRLDGFQEWEIRQAIANNQIKPFYQPKINLKTRQVDSVEALSRWLHPEHGTIMPAQFIAIAEEFNLIDDLSYSVIGQAIVDLGRWRAQGQTLGLSVNVSTKSLYHLKLPEQLMQYVEAARVDPDDIILEVTESQVFHDLSAPMEILTRLCLKGFGLSIDDFGTGYASLEQLNRLPFTELKLDKQFVQSAVEDPSSRIILESSINLARQLGMKIVAEGVEELSTLNLMEELHCDQVQGYYFAKPMSADVFERWLSQYQRGLLQQDGAAL